MTATTTLQQRRERLVLDHFADEVRQDWDDVLATFPHPHYELIPTGITHSGHEQVRRYYAETRVAFPDQHHEMIRLRHADDAVVCEFWLLGTHHGPLAGIPPTGRAFRLRMTAFFLFEGETLVCERIYFDTLTLLKQLLAGIDLRRPSGWWMLVKVLKALRAVGQPGPQAAIPDQPAPARS